MYGSHGLETGFNYELLNRFAKDNSCNLRIVAFSKHNNYLDSLKEAAAYCGMTESKCKTLLHRTRLGLREYLNQEGFAV